MKLVNDIPIPGDPRKRSKRTVVVHVDFAVEVPESVVNKTPNWKGPFNIIRDIVAESDTVGALTKKLDKWVLDGATVKVTR